MIQNRFFIGILILLGSVGWAKPLPLQTILSKDSRIIIFSPHPDDDVLGSSALMESILAMQAQGMPADLRVVYMTCGDGYDKALAVTTQKGTAKTYVELGDLRHREALGALNAAGVPSQEAIFLGFPDQGVDSLFAMDIGSATPYASIHTGETRVPYAFAYHPGEPYLKKSVVDDLKNIIADFKPTIVFTPTLTDQHVDHRATREFVTEVLSEIPNPPLHLEYLIHWEHTDEDWPRHTADWGTPLNHVPAEYFLAIKDYGLTIDGKKKIIGFHQSQVDVDGDYLLDFAKNTEMFWVTKPKMSDYLTTVAKLKSIILRLLGR